MVRTFLLTAALILLSAAAASARAGCTAPASASAMAGEILGLTNTARRQAGAQPLGYDRRLASAAQALACDLSRTGRISHRSSDGLNSQGRVRRAGYRECIVAENLAWGYPRPSQIVSGWIASPGHQRNMLHPRVDEAGIGIAEGANGPVWVMVYASEC